MALVLADRVQETTTSVGTGAVTLAGAVLGYQSFAVIGNGNTTFYTIAAQGGADWEVGIGTYTSSGTSLSRDTVLASSNGGSLVTFGAGIKAVFVTYPSEKSVNLDGSGNLVFNGTTTTSNLKLGNNLDTNGYSVIGGNYGGNQLVLPVGFGPYLQALYEGNVNIAVGTTGSVAYTSTFDQYGNLKTNSVTQSLSVVTSAGGTTTLTPASPHFQILTGSTTQTFQLPDATTLATGSSWVFDNDSTGNLFVVNAASGAVDTVAPGGYATVFLELNGTTAGTWGRFGMIPAEVNWGTNSLDLGGSTVITNGVWQGTAIASGYGGTGLTTFTAANYALYSTSSSALTAGTLPVAAGGTGVTTSSGANSVVIRDANASVSGSQLIASNGIVVNNKTIGTSYSIPSGYSATSAGPVSISSGVTVTVPSGSRWVVL